MEQQGDRNDPTAVLARRVKELRTKRGLSAAALAEQMQAVGVDWQRIVVTKLENGRRQEVSVRELLALAAVLEVAPVHLLVPLEDDAPYEVTPGREEAAVKVRAFVRGAEPLPGMDPGNYFAESPRAEFLKLIRDGQQRTASFTRDSGR